jgi:hypothetical protein
MPSRGTSPTLLAPVPTHREAEDLARALLASEGTRLAHVRTAGLVAQRLAPLFDEEQAALLVAAATLHDIGYSARISHFGFHPLDGALFLRTQGYSDRLAGLVAHHSLAHLTAGPDLQAELEAAFPREESLLADALAYADMHSAPDGRLIRAQARLAGIAARHPDRAEVQRGALLRAAITRVGTAMLAAQPRILPMPRSEGIPPAEPAERIPPTVLAAFESWWRAETRYQLACQEFTEGLPDRPVPHRESAVHLASLRSRADLLRDRYFRLALR